MADSDRSAEAARERAVWLLRSAADVEEIRRGVVVVGTLLMPSWTTREFVTAANSPVRDVVLLGERRVVAIRSRDPRDIGIRDAVAIVRRDVRTGIAATTTFSRDQLEKAALTHTPPLQGTAISVMFEHETSWLVLTAVEGELLFLHDDRADPQPDLSSRVAAYAAGRSGAWLLPGAAQRRRAAASQLLVGER